MTGNADPAGDNSGGDNSGADNNNSGGSWKDALNEQDRQDYTLKKFETPAELFQGYKELEKKVGQNTILMPTENSTTEELTDFNHKRGVPNDPSGYQLKVPEGIEVSDQDLSNFRADMHKADVTSKKAQDLFTDTYARNKEASDLADSDGKNDLANLTKERERILRGVWGSAHYDNNLEVATRTMEKYGGEDLIKILKENNLDKDPSLLQAFAQVAKSQGEDKLPDVGTGDPIMTTGDLIKRKTDLENNRDGPFYNKTHPDHNKAVDEYDSLNRQIIEAEEG